MCTVNELFDSTNVQLEYANATLSNDVYKQPARLCPELTPPLTPELIFLSFALSGFSHGRSQQKQTLNLEHATYYILNFLLTLRHLGSFSNNGKFNKNTRHCHREKG